MTTDHTTDHTTHDTDWLDPDPGYVRMPCTETVEDTQDAVTAHQRECVECTRELVLSP